MNESNLTSFTSQVSENLLQYLRDPADVIESIKEEIDIGRGLITSQVEITLKPVAREGCSYRYIDILHPNKGVPVFVEVHTDGVEVVSHAEHASAARDAIAYHFSSIAYSLLFSGTDAFSMVQVQEELGKVKADLEKLPYLSRSGALKVFRRYFEEAKNVSNGTRNRREGDWLKEHKWIQAILKIPGVKAVYSEDQKMSDHLYLLLILCKRLTHKYLFLLRVPHRVRTIRLTQERSYETQTAQLGRAFTPKRHILFGSVPTAFRYHIPWAKKTSHYQLSAKAPHGQFFAEARIITRDARTKAIYELGSDEPAHIAWSLSLNRGYRLMAFVSEGRLSVQPLYVTVAHRELPGRSLLRALTLSLTALLLMSALFIMRVFMDIELSSTYSFLIGLIALGGVASPWPKDNSPMGIPLLSRVTPGIVVAIVVPYIMWLSIPLKDFTGLDLASVGTTCWLLMLALNIRLGYRFRNQFRDQKSALENKVSAGGAFTKGSDVR